MNEEQILKKAIEKAVENGWLKGESGGSGHGCAMGVIFSHSFAKAFWGEEMKEPCSKDNITCWKHHLQQLVLEEQPLKYIEQFLNAETR